MHPTTAAYIILLARRHSIRLAVSLDQTNFTAPDEAEESRIVLSQRRRACAAWLCLLRCMARTCLPVPAPSPRSRAVRGPLFLCACRRPSVTVGRSGGISAR